MNLYLVRHAEAKSKEDDPARGLSDKGIADIRKVAAYVADHASIQVNSILNSGKPRAEQTAGMLADRLNPSDGVQTVEGLEPLADPGIWADRLAGIEQDTLLVGHLPHLSRLASRLLCGDDEKTVIAFQTAGIVCLGRDDAGSWSLRWMLVPELS